MLPLAALWAWSAAWAGPPPRWIDLTHAFDERAIALPGAGSFRPEGIAEGVTPAGTFYRARRFSMAEDVGTHLEAPIHFYRGRRSADEVPLEQLLGPAAVVDVHDPCASDPDYEVQLKDLLGWERRWGRIPEGAIVLIRTGFGRRWPDRKRYLGTEERGVSAVSRLHFPGLQASAARWLVLQRSVRAVGIDTASIDHGTSVRFETHVALAAANVPVFENVAHLDQLPSIGASVIALPMKIRGGSAAPVRIIATVGPLGGG